jgi:hypothetical protein
MNNHPSKQLGKFYLTRIKNILIPGFFCFTLSSCAYLGFEEKEPFQNPFAQSARDLSYGMRMNAVRQIWGEPSLRETPLSRSQNQRSSPSSGHERWIYRDSLSQLTPSQTRIVYFENGHVVGWETY